MEKDYYKILGVSKNASQNEIKKAYKELAIKHHPDKNKGSTDSENKMKLINEAYQVLRDIESKQKYDYDNTFTNSFDKTKYNYNERVKGDKIYYFNLTLYEFINGKEILINDYYIKNFVFKIPSKTKPLSIFELKEFRNTYYENYYILCYGFKDFDLFSMNDIFDGFYNNEHDYIKKLDVGKIYNYIDNNYFKNTVIKKISYLSLHLSIISILVFIIVFIVGYLIDKNILDLGSRNKYMVFVGIVGTISGFSIFINLIEFFINIYDTIHGNKIFKENKNKWNNFKKEMKIN